ncbi:MAG: PAS domain-containing protein [Lachnospiraceae bacterium]|nr:PAS domain-containing protein [Lachnospiraceae bacterium]
MELSKFFKSVIDQDQCAIVICNLEHEIIYMNPAAIARYAKSGGAELVGKSLLNCHNEKSVEMIHKVLDWFGESREHNRIFSFHNEKENRDVYMIALRDEDGTLIGYYEKHEFRNVETQQPYCFDA